MTTKSLLRYRWLTYCLVTALLPLSFVQAGLRAVDNRDSSYVIETWEADDGLPGNSVTAIAQDASGYLWIGTFGGLARFDGVKFDIFNPANTPEMPSAGIANLHIDSSGRLWASTVDGIVARDRSGRWRSYGKGDGFVGDYVRAFIDGRDGELLFSTNDGHLLEFREERFHELPPPANRRPGGFITGVDGNGRWWVMQSGLIARWSGRQWDELLQAPISIPNEEMGCAIARDGGLWILIGDELLKYRDDREVSRVKLQHRMRDVWRMSEDHHGNVWVTGRGLWRVSPNGDMLKWTNANGLAAETTTVAFEDREHNIWVATSGGGLQRFRPRRFQSFGTADGLPERIVNSVWPQADGGALVATYGKGLFRVDGARLDPVPLPAPHAQHIQGVMVDRAGRTWVGTFGLGLYLIASDGARQIPIEQTGGTNVVALFEDSRGRVWAGGGDGATVVSEGRRVIKASDGAPVGSLCCFAEDSSGAIWATNRRRVYRIDDANGTFVEVVDKDGASLADISYLCAGADGSMWLASRSRGLLLFDNNRVIDVDTKARLNSGGIGSIIADNDGHLWMTTRLGMLRVRMSDLLAVVEARATGPVHVQRFDESDGLPTKDFTATRQPTCARDASGRLWFATARGFASVHPRDISSNVRAADTLIDSVSFVAPNSTTRRDAARVEQGSAALPAGSRRIEIQYTALSIGAPHKVRFRVKLDGYDTDWQDVGTERVAQYYELPPRGYVFRVQATNDDGHWNDQLATTSFRIEPFFWQTGWFLSLLVCALVGGGSVTTWSILHARHRRARERLVLLEQRNELLHLSRVSMLGEISGSLAHEVGQPLTAILCNAEAAQRFLARDEVDRKELAEILDAIVFDNRRACEVIDRLRPLLRRGEVRPQSLSVNDTITDVLKIVDRELVHQGVSVRTQLQSNLPNAQVNRVQLQQVLINLIFNGRDAMTAPNNGVERALLVMSERAHDGSVRVTVSDQGGGIAADQLERIFEPFVTSKRDGMGLGLSLCRTIIDAHGGELWATNNPTAGASFHFTLPIAKST